ncbi:LysR family transcriptional regulator [Suttonella sp. R2A3]|uniref:LysR family transcriptional regulator n=1 Tax=Suttonella sp. R2A3 TaxID=2908648 RepID=UPI001F3D5CE6|nr:LysR family transcriptional regulator [Suttonella sp. R2A3]UJF24967.1 LysR family transcriptional regulator [Suttonella sp. R2A3]
MNWNDVRYFICLVNEQTLSAAAEKLDVQHTTVARRVAALEEALNVRLFDRMGKRYTLTQEGQILYGQACDIENSMHTLHRMAIKQTVMQGVVTLSAPPVLVNEILAPKLSDFYKQYPDIYLNIQGEVRHSNLYHRESDIALRLNRPSEQDLVIRKLGDIDYHFYAHKDYWQRCQNGFCAWRWVAFQANTRLQSWFEQIKQRRDGNVVFSTNDFYLAKNAIKNQLGMGILPAFLACDDTQLVAVNPIKGDLLVANPNQDSDIFRRFALYLVMHEDLRHTPRIRAVADWLISAFARV